MKSKKEKLVAVVTGARGLIGSHLVHELCDQGWYVKILTRGKTVLDMHDVSVIRGDINDESVMQELLSNADAVFHCAAELNDESKMHDVNIKGVETLLRILSSPSASASYFCYISSAGVVGPTQAKVVTEETVCHPRNEYEKTKYEAEKLVLSSEFNGHICILRPTNVIGCSKKGLVELPLRDSWKDRVMCFIKGNEGAHIVHAKDVAFAALFFYNNPTAKAEIFFVSCDEDNRNTLLGVYNLVIRISDRQRKSCLLSLPVFIPFIVRSLLKKTSLHGHTRFSSKKIREAGFIFSLGLESALVDVCEIKKEP